MKANPKLFVGPAAAIPPFVATTIPVLTNAVKPVDDFLAAVAANPLFSLQLLETEIEKALNLDPADFKICIDDTPNAVLANSVVTGRATGIFNPGGFNNGIVFTARTTGVGEEGIRIAIEDDSSVQGTGGPIVTYDATKRVVHVKINSTVTWAEQVVAAVNAVAMANPLFPVRAGYVAADQDARYGAQGSGILAKTALKIMLSYDVSYTNGGQTFTLNVADLVAQLPPSLTKNFLEILTDVVQIGGSGEIVVNASASVIFDVGIDLTDTTTLTPFFYDDTGLDFTLRVDGSNLRFQIAAGPLGGFIQGGTLTLNADGDPTNTNDAELTVGFSNGNGDGRHYFRDGFNLEDIKTTFVAGVSAILPVYAPIQTLPLGGTADLDADGYPDNQIVIDIPELKRLIFPYKADGSGNVTIEPVGPNNDYEISGLPGGTRVKFVHQASAVPVITFIPGAPGEDPILKIGLKQGVTLASDIVDAINLYGSTFGNQSMDAMLVPDLLIAQLVAPPPVGPGAVKLPVFIVGPDFRTIFDSIDVCDIITNAGPLLDGLDDLLKKVQTGLVTFATNTQKTYPILANDANVAVASIMAFRAGLLYDMRTALTAVGGDALGLVRQAIYNSIGPGGLNILVDFATGLPTITKPDDIEIVCQNKEIDFRLRLKDSLTFIPFSAGATTPWTLGPPSPNLSVSGAVSINLSYDVLLDFGLNATKGFFAVTTHPDPANPLVEVPEYQATLTGTIPGITATGTLGFLSLTATDSATKPTLVTASIAVDLVDPRNDDDKLTFADLKAATGLGDIFHASVGVTGAVCLDLVLSAGAALPKIRTNFVLTINLTAKVPSTVSNLLAPQPPPSTVTSDITSDITIAFNNVRIDAGSMISDFIQPILGGDPESDQAARSADRGAHDAAAGALRSRRAPYTLLSLARDRGLVSTGTVAFINQWLPISSLINDFDTASGRPLRFRSAAFPSWVRRCDSRRPWRRRRWTEVPLPETAADLTGPVAPNSPNDKALTFSTTSRRARVSPCRG